MESLLSALFLAWCVVALDGNERTDNNNNDDNSNNADIVIVYVMLRSVRMIALR